ncbi:MAG: hypothetical protein R3E86_05330 [Pseudomonadales bacterium]
MTTSDDGQWVEPVAGFEYLPDTIEVSPAHQAEKLEACGLDADIYAGLVDPSFFIGIAIHAGIRSGISAEGNINMLQSLVQHRPARLGEPLAVRGRITAVTQVPRGRTIDTDVWFADARGERVVTARRRSLKPDPDRAGTRGAGERPAAVIEDVAALTSLADYELTPDRVRAYSMEGNSIHYELDAAQRAGFRAPLIGGGMGVHYCMAALWSRFQPETLDLDIYFRRPIFWDDRFTVAARQHGSRWSAIGLVKEGKVLTEARINALA